MLAFLKQPIHYTYMYIQKTARFGNIAAFFYAFVTPIKAYVYLLGLARLIFLKVFSP